MKLRCPDLHVLVISLLVALLFLVSVGLTLDLRFHLTLLSPDQLLDDALMRPGEYGIERDSSWVSIPAPLTPWNRITYGKADLSKKKLARLQSYRAAIIPVLVKRLQQIDFTRRPVEVPPDIYGGERRSIADTRGSGVDPKAFSNLLLDIIFELNAIETLPALLDVEAKLHDALLHLENDPLAPFPQIDGFDNANIMRYATPKEENDARDWHSVSNDEKRKRRRIDQICYIQVAHRDTLALIGLLLRKERNPALLATSVEKQFQKGLRKNLANSKDLKTYKTPGDIPEEQREHTYFDPILNIPRLRSFKTQIPYTEALRDEIIQAARTHKPN